MSSLEDIFGKLALTTVTTVSRIALSHATNAAIRNVTSYISTQLPKNKQASNEIRTLQRQLDLKVKNLKPTIDIIAKSVANGNEDLEPALEMCNDLKRDIDNFANQVDTIKEPEQVKYQLKRLLENIDDAIPSLHLALRSIENQLGRATVSPSRLVRASSVLNSDSKTFTLKLYSLFTANQRDASAYAFTWKEEFHKCKLTVSKKDWNRTLVIQEDLNDGLYHEEDEEGKKMTIEIENIERMYYTQSGELLNIEDAKTSVLVLKVLKEKKSEKEEESKVETKQTAPEIIKEELRTANWYAFGLWNDDDDDEQDTKVKKDTLDILLLESVIKLCSLEAKEQMSHLEASDELIQLYMT
ncbi:hypothetical protein CU097_002106 [Rhizopus azygosporus]|uniref:Ran-specific GTPase-activating protein 30 n=1 Tax=Rhizopus azygosporus TaxID=86630 RepID=A0A367J842_RHIAZ|nr:hypothetical protein CU097_002106 [Rhizopus azygosporus]